MRDHEFYGKYANLPLNKRFVPLDITHHGMKTISDVYKRMKEIDDHIRPYLIEKEDLLRLSEKILK